MKNSISVSPAKASLPLTLPAFANAATYRTVAERIAARLCRDALWDRDRCNWMGSAMEPIHGTWTVTRRSFGPDLYSGTSGIALFLGRTFDPTGDRVASSVVSGAVAHAISQSRNLAPSTRLGFYCGGTGIAEVLLELGVKFGREDWIAHADTIVTALAEDDVERQPMDVISGSAGAIPFLIGWHRKRDSELAMDLALRHGQRLLRSANQHSDGWSWPTISEARRDLLGFSHGTAGIAWALLELHAVSGNVAFREAAEQAIAYEQHWFDPTRKNWPDFRDHSAMPGSPAGDQSVFATAWCHGAPGIGFARLRAFELTGNRDYLAQAQVAIDTTLASFSDPSSFSGSQCLCHGAMGNLELLMAARTILGTDIYDGTIQRFADIALATHEFQNGHWPCGVLGGGETPGLLLGLSGIGHSYLMLARPTEMSSLLLPRF